MSAIWEAQQALNSVYGDTRKLLQLYEVLEGVIGKRKKEGAGISGAPLPTLHGTAQRGFGLRVLTKHVVRTLPLCGVQTVQEYSTMLRGQRFPSTRNLCNRRASRLVCAKVAPPPLLFGNLFAFCPPMPTHTLTRCSYFFAILLLVPFAE